MTERLYNVTMNAAPTVAVVSDIAGYGRCSLTVALGALSALGVQPVPLPTAVLSTHTGGFGTVVKRDLSDFIAPCAGHWQDIGLRFDAILTGYLTGAGQAEAMRALLDAYPESLRVVDPVMGDGGRMYASLPDDMPSLFRSLAQGAACLTPNYTEACLLAEVSYEPDALSVSRAEKLLRRLLDATGAMCALIKGVRLQTVTRANCWLCKGDAQAAFLPYRQEPGAYPGTGDLFAAILTGALVLGTDMADAVALAAGFVRDAVARTNAIGSDPRTGVQFEPILGRLCEWRKDSVQRD